MQAIADECENRLIVRIFWETPAIGDDDHRAGLQIGMLKGKLREMNQRRLARTSGSDDPKNAPAFVVEDEIN